MKKLLLGLTVITAITVQAQNNCLNTRKLSVDTISNPNNLVNFAGDTIATTGKVKAASLKVSGSSVTMPGLAIDTNINDSNSNLMVLSPSGKVETVGPPLINAMHYPLSPTPRPILMCIDNMFPQFSVPPTWYKQVSYDRENFVTGACTWVGICESGMSGYPDAPLSISTVWSTIQFSIANPTTKVDNFTVDYNGNTYVAGNVGIGITPSSVAQLNIMVPATPYTYAFSVTNSSSQPLVVINPAGQVVIGNNIMSDYSTTNPYGLYVGNGILANEVKIAAPGGSDWSDYVLANNYKLKPLNEVAQFIKENRHLPDVPSAGDVQKNGIDVAQMDATLLKKIEELTLYIIQQQQNITKEQQQSQEQQKEIEALKAQLESLEKVKK